MAPTGAAATVFTTADALLPPPATLHQINKWRPYKGVWNSIYDCPDKGHWWPHFERVKRITC